MAAPTDSAGLSGHSRLRAVTLALTGLFAVPAALASAPQPGDLIAADAGSSNTTSGIVWAAAPSGNRNFLTGGSSGSNTTSPALDTPEFVAVVSGGATVYYYEETTNSVMSLTVGSGTRAVVSGGAIGTGTAFLAVSGMAWDSTNSRLIVSDSGSSSATAGIIAVDPSTGNRTFLTGNGSGSGEGVDNPGFVVLDSSGNIYYGDSFESGLVESHPGIVAVNPGTGARTLLSGGSAPAGTGSAFVAVSGLAWDGSHSKLIVSDAGSSSSTAGLIAVDLSTGNRSFITGNGSGSGLGIDNPSFASADSGGDLYYFDSFESGTVESNPGIVGVNYSTGARTLFSGGSAPQGTGTAFVAGNGLAAVPGALAPSISSVTGPSAATYTAGQNLTFTVVFSSAVTATGTPQIGIKIGAVSHNANYTSGSGTTTLTFAYTVQAGDNGGVTIPSATISLNGGTLQATVGGASANLTFTAPNTSSVLVSTGPTVTAGASATFTGGGSPAVLDSGLTITDLSAANLTGATVTIGSPVTGDTLAFNSGTNTQTFADTSTITATFSAGALTLTGTASLADYQAALQSVTYSVSPSNTDPTNGGAATSRTLTWQVTDSNSQSSTGVTSTLTIVHAAPTVTAGGTATFNGGGSAVTLDSGVSVSDSDSGGNLTGATVAISSGYLSGDTLNFANGNGITGAYSAGSHTLTLSGTSSVANYQTALESITFSFSPANGDPTNLGADLSRTLSWTATDGSSSNGTSATATSTLDLSHVAPVVVAGGSANFSTGGSAVILDSGLTVADADSAGNIHGATVAITTGFLAGDTLNFTNQNNITGSYDAVHGVLALSGTDTLAHYQTALDAITYSSSASDPTDGGTDLTRTVTWVVSDGSTSNGSSTGVTSSITQAPVILSITPPTSGNYVAGGMMTFVVNFSVAVNVTGAPTLSLTIDGTGESANYVSGSGTSALTFSYTVQSTDTAGPVALISPLALNGGTIDVASGNTPAVLAFSPSPQTLSGVAVVFVPTITWATPTAIIYGTALDATQFDATAAFGGSTVAGTYQYNFATGTVLHVGTQTLTVIFYPTDTVHYSTAMAEVSLVVSQATPSITWATPAPITYGTALTSAQLNASIGSPGPANGNVLYSPGFGKIPTAGNQTLTVTFTPYDSTDYTAATATVTLTVNQVVPVVTWSAPSAITYGTALSSTQLNAMASVPGAFTYAQAGGAAVGVGTVLGAGASQALTVTFTPTDSVDYSSVMASTTITVNQATPTITWATPLSIPYGTVLSSTQLNAAAMLGTSTVAGTPTYTPAAGTVLPVGSNQALSVSFTPTDTTDFTGASGSTAITVTQATQTINFPVVSPPLVGTSVTLSATASSGLTPVNFAVVSGNATFSGSSLTIADTNPVVVSATQAGNTDYLSATATQTITATTKLPQTITFSPISLQYTQGHPFQVTATASSGLPITFSIVSGPATVSGSTIILTGTTGTVVVQANQPGNILYQPATPEYASFQVTSPTYLTYQGQTSGQSGMSADGKSARADTVSSSNNIAATLSSDGTNGMIIGYLPSLGQGFAVEINPNNTGSYSVTTTTLGGTGAPVTLTITGTATAGGVSGTIAPLGLTFGMTADPTVGPTASISGLYASSNVNTSSGSTYSIVGTQGDVFVLTVTPTVVAAGAGTVNTANNSFDIETAQSVAVTGSVNAASQTVSGTVTSSGGTVSYSGASAAVNSYNVLTNMSARGFVTPASPLTVGFVVDGTVPKTVVLRGVGPGLAPFGVPTPLMKPLLTLYDHTGSVVGTNAGWAGAPSLTSAFLQVGAFALPLPVALPAGSADTALETTLAAGPYTVVISDAGNDSGGNAMAEIYDASIDVSEVTQSLVNISTRGQVTAANPLVGGFVVGGNSPKTVLIRGIGPALTAFGVSGALSDPMLTVYNSSSTVVAQNNGWGTPDPINTAQVTATAAQITAADASAGAFGLTSGSLDSAIIVTLAPGNYSAVVTGSNGSTGAALVEVYELSQ